MIKHKAVMATWARSVTIAILIVGGVLLLQRGGRAATGTLVPALYQTVLDSNGNPVSGAKVCTYLSGTTTPVTTYTDVGLTVPAANPITADSAGRWAAYLATGVSYKFVLQDATGTAGVCNGATIRTIDGVAAIPGTANPTVAVNTADCRLTLTSGVPITSADVTAATTVYVTPYQGNRIALYDGTQWNLRTLTETAITVPATTGSIYDVFAVDTLTVPTFETQIWTNDAVRATALALQDGVLSKSGQLTRRYIGTFRTTGVAGQTEDSLAKRYVFNYAHRVRRPLQRLETTATWSYNTATIRQANGATANQVDVVVGIAEVPLDVHLIALARSSVADTSIAAGIGEDSTTAMVSGQIGMYISTVTTWAQVAASLRKMPAIGRHYYTWLEKGDGSSTNTWAGTNSLATERQAGLAGWIEG
jgi:hypothetical protein